jgi:transposase InsO family protein
MRDVLKPLHLLLHWYSELKCHELRKRLDYQDAQLRVLREALGKKRLRFTPEQRRLLAAKAAALGRKVLRSMTTIVTPDTLMAWHRKLIAEKWTHPRRVGRPRKSAELCALVVRVAKENATWGIKRIEGVLRNLDYRISRTTIGRILAERGIPLVPERLTSWRQFVRSHAATIAAMDFFTTEVWTWTGLQTWYTLFAIDHQTRAVQVLGTTPHPDGSFMAQVARNITSVLEGWWRNKTMVLFDRDTKFTAQFRRILEHAGLQCIPLPPRAPDANAIAERFVRSIKSECLDRLIPFGVESLHRALREYLAHYNGERNHQGIGNELIAPRLGDVGGRGRVVVRRRLGGLLNFYRRKAG